MGAQPYQILGAGSQYANSGGDVAVRPALGKGHASRFLER